VNWQPLKPDGKYAVINRGIIAVFKRAPEWWEFFGQQGDRLACQDHQTEAAAMQAAEAWVKGEKRV